MLSQIKFGTSGCCEMVACRGKSLGEQLKAMCNQVGSYYPQRQNFRLTPAVKAKFTENGVWKS